MSERIEATKPIGQDYNKAQALDKFDNEKKIKQTSIFTPSYNNIAFAPQGGIGQLLNGTGSQPSQTAVQA